MKEQELASEIYSIRVKEKQTQREHKKGRE
jgi:hypothetical protein